MVFCYCNCGGTDCAPLVVATYAESGECESNPVYMIGDKGKPGDCIKACGRCDIGPNAA